jgi:CRP-like cAMP-binding protein
MMQLYDVIDVGGPKMLQDKLRSVLYWFSKHYAIAGRDGSVELWVSQTELAEGVGASRQRVHMELQNLRDLGEIDLAYRKVIIRPVFFERFRAEPH